MKPSLDKLYRFFKLEAERGYDNRAVVGGLNRILDTWEMEARLDELPEEIIQAVSGRLRDYSGLSEASRQESLKGLWRRLQRESGESLPDITFPPRIPAPPPEASQEPVQAELTSTPTTVSEDAQVEGAIEPTPEDRLTPQAEVEAEEDVEPAPDEQPAPQAKVEADTETEPIPTEKHAPQVEIQPAALNAPITVLSGVGPRNAQTLGRLGLSNLGDMLYNFPRRYDDYTLLKPINRLNYGEEVTVIGTVQSVNTRSIRGGQAQIVEAVISDSTGNLRLTWFNQPWISKRLRRWEQISTSGKVDQYLGRLVMNNPEFEPIDQEQLNTNRIVPVYPLTAQITQRWLRRLMNQVVTYWAPRVQDPLPERVRKSASLLNLTEALLQAHFPDTWDKLKSARHRLAFDEIFFLQLGVLQQKQAWRERTARVYTVSNEWLEAQLHDLPFPLTSAQERSLGDLRADLASGHPMNRLLQGDVGSGKTVVAALSIAMLTQHGAQSALMAPTSILAEQHYQSMAKLLSSEKVAQQALDQGSQSTAFSLAPEQIRLLVGGTPESEKVEIREGLASGSIKLVVGTHALLEDPVEFADLELVIVDEQHRFGVEQRAALRSKGTNPHLLVMTATPIPRSLALTVYGDLDLSVMDEMPPGRLPVRTHVLTPRERERAYSLIRSQVEAGHQAFIIYPLVEESDKSDSKAAVEEHDRLQKQVFPDFKLGLLHGRLKPEEKEDVMTRFHARDYQVLVSTTVIEVGVDVPNATVMLIEGANRFGLAQLHQLRGRVGRGGERAFCLLIPESADAVENERLRAMVETTDGFVLAERDLEQRGPGDFLGTRQSGYSELKLANLSDVRLIEKARREAVKVFEYDPTLERPEHELMRATLERTWSGGKGDIS